MAPKSEKTPAELYIEATEKLEQAIMACEKAATNCRKVLRTLKKTEVARSKVDAPKPPAA